MSSPLRRAICQIAPLLRRAICQIAPLTGILLSTLISLTGLAEAATLRERWGASGIESTHPNALKVAKKGKVSVLDFDLSALPKDAKVHRATLCNKRVSQPKDPIQICVVGKINAQGEPEYEGKPLTLEAPRFASYDLTAQVRSWQRDPGKNLGLALARAESFDPKQAFLEICYEGAPKDPPPQVSNLKALHHDGQTFLTWKEMSQFQPASDKTLWTGNYTLTKHDEFTEPGKDSLDLPRLNCIRQSELRRLQMYDVIPPTPGTQNDPKYVRQKGWPDVGYRIYRSKNKITAENLKDAELVGEADTLCAYDLSMVGIGCRGEYYDKHELPETPIPTYCLEDGKAIPLGEAFYVQTAQDDGAWFYAVTVAKSGTENMTDVSAGNSLQAPIEEKKAPFKPILQFVVDEGTVRRYKHYCWPAPPACNLPSQRASIVALAVPKALKEPFSPGLLIRGRSRGNDWLTLNVSGRFGYIGELAYSEGLGTFRAMSECQVDYFDERYMLYSIQGIISKWKVDRNRIEIGGGTAFALRHPELFKIMYSGTTDFFEINFEPRWNPGCNQLFAAFGPPDANALTGDGLKAWDIVGAGWYLRNNPAKDIPFFFCYQGGKESGHAVEFGWQDDPMGWAAMRDGRVPYAGAWNGGRISKEVGDVVGAMPLDATLPAFSNCSLDSNPGNGDPEDGDLWGQLNGFLIWDFQTSVEKPDRWEMTVGLAKDAPQPACTVDITPRRCRVFKPRAGETFTWSGTPLAGDKPAQSGQVTADQWGLVTLKHVAVTQGRNRITVVVGRDAISPHKE